MRSRSLAFHPRSKGKLDPHRCYEHFDSEQGTHYAGEKTDDEQETPDDFQGRNELSHYPWEGDRYLGKVGRHVTKPSDELLVSVHSEEQPGHDAHSCHAPGRAGAEDASHYRFPPHRRVLPRWCT